MRDDKLTIRGLFPIALVFILLSAICAANPALAHHDGDHAVTIHTNDTWDDCAIVLDPSLTQSEFHDFSKEVAPILYFKPLAGARPLGKLNFSVSIEMWRTAPLEDYKGKWNNTFSHPESDHWLTGGDHSLKFPILRGRMGVTDSVDAEFYYAKNFAANYGFAGLAVKYAVLTNHETGFDLAARASVAELIGVADMKYFQGAVDALVSWDVHMFRPYAGLSFAHSSASETTSKVDLHGESINSAAFMLGGEFNWSYFSAALEAHIAVINMYSVRIGASF